MMSYLDLIIIFDLNNKIQHFFENGLKLCKNMLKQNLKLHFIIYDTDNKKTEEVDIDTYINDRLYTLIKEYLEEKNIILSNNELHNITQNYINIYYPNFLKELYD